MGWFEDFRDAVAPQLGQVETAEDALRRAVEESRKPKENLDARADSDIRNTFQELLGRQPTQAELTRWFDRYRPMLRTDKQDATLESLRDEIKKSAEYGRVESKKGFEARAPERALRYGELRDIVGGQTRESLGRLPAGLASRGLLDSGSVARGTKGITGLSLEALRRGFGDIQREDYSMIGRQLENQAQRDYMSGIQMQAMLTPQKKEDPWMKYLELAVKGAQAVGSLF